MDSKLTKPTSNDNDLANQMRGWFSRLVPDFKPIETGSNQPAECESPESPDLKPSKSDDEATTDSTTGSDKIRDSSWPGSISGWVQSSLLGLEVPLQSVSKSAMACEFEVLLNERQYPLGVEVAFECMEMIEHIEDLLSVYRASSQFSKINQFGGERSVYVDPKTLELVLLAQAAYAWTEGCFDMTAGSLSEAWGFSRRQGAMPTQQQIDAALEFVGSQFIQIDQAQSTIHLSRPGVKLNPGGIGKGYAIDRAVKILLRAGINDFMIHGGLSSIAARGKRQGVDSDWTVALKHPWRTEELIETIPLRDKAIGTSGSGKQFFHFNGRRYSHIIDPRTGWPAQQMMSVTVVCPSCAIADAVATGLFVMGVEKSVEFCERFSDVAAVLIFQDAKSGSQRIEHLNWNLID
ncbi:MAG: FAD:protein FMN transferase [Pirellulales bacterium]